MNYINRTELEVLQEAVALLKKYPDNKTVVKEQCGILIEYSNNALAGIRTSDKFNSKVKHGQRKR